MHILQSRQYIVITNVITNILVTNYNVSMILSGRLSYYGLCSNTDMPATINTINTRVITLQ